MAYSVPANPEWDLQGLLDKVPDLAKKAIAGGVFLGEIDDIADRDDVSAEVLRLQGQKFSFLRTLSRDLGATQDDRRADFAADDKSQATIKRIAELRVPVNSSFILLTKEEAFVLETVATEIGADQDKIDECVDDDDEIETNLIKLIFETDGNFLFWEHTPKPEKKKQKVTSGQTVPPTIPPIVPPTGPPAVPPTVPPTGPPAVQPEPTNFQELLNSLESEPQQDETVSQDHHAVIPALNRITASALFQSAAQAAGQTPANADGQHTSNPPAGAQPPAPGVIDLVEQEGAEEIAADQAENILEFNQVQKMLKDAPHLSNKQKAKIVSALLKDKDVNVNGGQSPTLKDLQQLSGVNSDQGNSRIGSLTVLSKLPPHLPPSRPFSGQMPVLLLSRLKKDAQNTVLISWFNADSTKPTYQLQYEEHMESHLCTVNGSNADSILKSLVKDHTAQSKISKLIPIKSIQRYQEVAGYWLYYCSSTTPPLIPNSLYPKASKFISDVLKEMKSADADNTPVALQIFMQAVDLAIIDWATMYPPEDFPWTFKDLPCMEERVTTPLKDLQTEKNTLYRMSLGQLTSKIETLERMKNVRLPALQQGLQQQQQKQPVNGKWEPQPGSMLAKVLAMPKAKKEHLRRKVNGVNHKVCLKFSESGQCGHVLGVDGNGLHKNQQHGYSHHCAACGSTAHGLSDHP